MSKPYLSVIIPAYNEAKRIPKTLIDIDKYLSLVSYDYEIIVVNDGSSDNTTEVVKSFAGSIKNLTLVDNQKNGGKGAVVIDGMKAATGAIRLFMDADNSTALDQFNKMLPYFSGESDDTSDQGSIETSKKRYDVVIGSRAIKGSQLHPPQPWFRQIPGKIGNLFIQTILLWGIWDSQCGFKAFTEEAAETIFPIMKIKKWGFDVESLALAKHFGLNIKEVPVYWANDIFSHVKASAYLQVLLETIKIRWWLWNFNKYYKPESRS